MRHIVHLSDLHFGRVDYGVLGRLKEKVGEIKPDLVVVSGDLTQRARTAEFQEAAAFLNELPHPQIVVPGNHDIPLHNVYDRFVHPLDKYKAYITADLTPFFSDEEIAAVGVSTARSLTIKDGRINKEQVAGITARLCKLPDEMLKIVVTHHPFDLPENFDAGDIIGRAKKAIGHLTDCGADVFLAGHLHVSHVGEVAKRYKLAEGRSALVIQAGTATSTRGRGEANSFNLIEFSYPDLLIRRLECRSVEDGFKLVHTKEYKQTAAGWSKIAEG